MPEIQVDEVNNDVVSENNAYHFFRDVSTRQNLYNILGRYTDDPQQLLEMIQHPMEYNEAIRDISNCLYSSNGNLRNTVDYIKALPTLDCVVTNYLRDNGAKVRKELMLYALKKIKHKVLVRDFIHKGCVDGTAFYYFVMGERKLSKKKSMTTWDVTNISEINSKQELNALKSKLAKMNLAVLNLPVDYCRIIGFKNNSYVVAFNLAYFDEGLEGAQEKLRKYPSEFQKAYDKYHKGTGQQEMVLDNNKTMVFKISSKRDEPWGRPLVLAAILDILYADYFTNTKRNTLDEVNNKLVYQTFPEGKQAGTSALTDKQQASQHEAVKGAVLNKNNRGGTTFVSVAAGTKINVIDTKTDIFDDKYESKLDDKIGTDLGFAAALLNASGSTSFSSQQTNLELVTAQIFKWIEEITEEINKVINYNVLKLNYIDASVNYLPITHLNKKQMVGYVKDLYLQGKGSLTLWASAVGISPEVFYAMLDEELEADIENRYPVHKTSYTQSSKDINNQGGRPTNDNPTNANTIQSKTNGSNNQPKPNNS